MSPFAEQRRTRPVKVAKVVTVDGGLHQGQCVCRWHGHRHRHVHDADRETATHVASCGLCIAAGRDYMETCTCANCAKRRIVRREFGGHS